VGKCQECDRGKWCQEQLFIVNFMVGATIAAFSGFNTCFKDVAAYKIIVNVYNALVALTIISASHW